MLFLTSDKKNIIQINFNNNIYDSLYYFADIYES